MFLWFVACGVLLVATVFDSPGIDYRFVAAGSVLPLAEDLTGSPWVLHTLAGGALLLTAVMAATAGRGRRLLRRRWLGLPIGALTFLIASGSWLRTELFWWPFAGTGGAGSGHPPGAGSSARVACSHGGRRRARPSLDLSTLRAVRPRTTPGPPRGRPPDPAQELTGRGACLKT